MKKIKELRKELLKIYNELGFILDSVDKVLKRLQDENL